MTDTCKLDKYYTVREVAEIKEIRRQSVIDGCKRGQYPGAYKTTPDAVNRQGIWLIPKTSIDSATMVQDVVTVTRALSPADFQTMIDQSIEKAIGKKMQQLEQRLENHDRLLMETLRAIQEKNNSKKKSFWKFWEQ